MRIFLTIGFLSFIATSFQLLAQNIFINEVSQGEGGSEEYVEFVVVGEPSCTNQQPCLDLRGVVFDDNDGSYGPGGVAAGALRFANNSFWQCIPVGTMIVVYNDSERNYNLPADDLNPTDGNFTLIIPGNSNLFERHTTLPNSSNFNYSTTGWVNNGNWTSVGMRNAGDLMQIRQNASSSTALNSIGFGSITPNTNIYFPGNHGGKVISFKNIVSNDPVAQENWVSEETNGNETPGQANNPANSAWINALRNGTATNNVTLSSTKVDTGCGATCTGSINLTPAGGAAPYTYEWSNNATTQNLSNLCPGVYEVEVTDALGCTATESVSIASTGASITITDITDNETCADACDGSIATTFSGGTAPYTVSWSNGATNADISNLCDGTYTITVTDQAGCSSVKSMTIEAGQSGQTPVVTPVGAQLTSSATVTLAADITGGTWSGAGVSQNTFNPAIAGVGNHQVCYTVGAGACAQTACITIEVTEGCSPQNYPQTISACPGESITFDGDVLTTAGEYNYTFTDINGCDSIINLTFSHYITSPFFSSQTLCLGDFTEVNGIFYDSTQVVNYETIDGNGCILQNAVTITVNDCSIPEFNVFIPNTFTPNGDYVNDYFEVVISGGELLDGAIFNRWGQVVKEFSSTDLQWHGFTQSGQDSPDGVYTYLVRIQRIGGVVERFNGFVTLIR